ncbi:pentatricopeptide repeat-containing protein [Striga asiatica]|uniref:Pentatricopeptide repeat-containing protein n=1 Tax=Striga asiatica TaxID=4170 RepID=A0A5A7PGY0_STRAF|nr:pentatricopeptide repeat-containing protein [Striga asiatica]
MLFELEQECLDAYRKKVDQASHSRAQLRQAVADAEAQLADISSVMGDRPIHVNKSSGSLKKELQAIMPLLEDMKKKILVQHGCVLPRDPCVASNDEEDEFKSVLSGTDVEARRPFCNCLIDICRKRNLHRRAHELLYLGTVYGLYQGLHTKTEEEWRLNVQSLSVGAAETTFEEWMGTLVKIVQRKESLPAFSASTGAGTHKFSHGLGRAFASHVEKMAAPFHESERKSGLFVATREDLVLWVESKAFTS